MVFLELLVMLVVILVAAEVFTNALEHLGEKLKISEGVTGSLFAAVGTALPETMVPLLALMAGTSSRTTNEEIGVGAILGAPLMLSTLSLSLMAFAVVAKRGAQGEFRPEKTGLLRDLNFFLAAFAFATLALYIPHDMTVVRAALGISMVLIYFVYIMLTLRASKSLVHDGHATEADEPMFLCRLGLPNRMPVILLQLAAGLGLLIFGAHGFIHGVEAAADRAAEGAAEGHGQGRHAAHLDGRAGASVPEQVIRTQAGHRREGDGGVGEQRDVFHAQVGAQGILKLLVERPAVGELPAVPDLFQVG
jgi:cation:H+ antiporter